MHHGNLWNKLGRQLRESSGRQAWVVRVRVRVRVRFRGRVRVRVRVRPMPWPPRPSYSLAIANPNPSRPARVGGTAREAATVCDPGCNPMYPRLQPYVSQAATLCIPGVGGAAREHAHAPRLRNHQPAAHVRRPATLTLTLAWTLTLTLTLTLTRCGAQPLANVAHGAAH
jgi:hypothetical protein